MKEKINPYTYAGLLTAVKRQTSNNIDKLFLTIHELFDVSREDLVSASRLGDIVDLRRIAMYYLNKKMGMTSIMTGKILGRDHATVLYNVNKVEELYEYDPKFRKIYEDIMSSLNDKVNYKDGTVIGDIVILERAKRK
jgi:chromosomal replication initiation ATPase DnaA